MQGSGGDADIENRLTDMADVSKKERVGRRERVAWTHTH